MAKPWNAVASSPEFQALPPEQQEAARLQYFNEVVAPRVPKESLNDARAQFDAATTRNALAALQDPNKLDYEKLTAQAEPVQEMTGGQRFAAGVGQGIADIGRGIGQLTGAVSRDDVIASRNEDRALMASTAAKWGRFTGDVGTMFVPGGALKLGAKALSSVPRAASMMDAAGTAMLIPKTIGQGVGVGAGYGLVQPSASTGETVTNILLGGTAGGVVPGLSRMGPALEPFSDAGQKRIVGRFARKMTGGKELEAIRNLRTQGEIVPGSRPTYGQASLNEGIAAMERTAAATNPVAMVEKGGILRQQNLARAKALERMAGDETDREMLEVARKSVADQLYGKAFKAGINQKKLTGKTQKEINNLLENPLIQDAIPAARKTAKIDGIEITKDGSLEGLHFIKLELDKILHNKNPLTAVDRNTLRQVSDAKERLVFVLQRLSPKYAEAMAEFQAMSRPLDQANIVQEIMRRSSSSQLDPITGAPKIYAEKIAATLKNGDEIARSVTGYKKARLADILDPDQIKAIQDVAADAGRAQWAESAGRGPGSDTVQKLAFGGKLNANPGRLAYLIGRAVPGGSNIGAGLSAAALAARDFVYSGPNATMADKLARMTPAELADAMESVTPQQRSIVLKTLLRGSGSAFGYSVPAALNAQK